MTSPKRTTRCRILSIASPRPATAAQPGAVLALIGGQRVINLAEVACAIEANRNLSYCVTEAACREFGWHWLSVEEAIVLLGRKRLCALLSSTGLHGRSASQFAVLPHTNHNPPQANFRQPETFQGEPE